LVLSDLPPSPLCLKMETEIKTITFSNWASNNFFITKGKIRDHLGKVKNGEADPA
jgi:hypothetical protein